MTDGIIVNVTKNITKGKIELFCNLSFPLTFLKLNEKNELITS